MTGTLRLERAYPGVGLIRRASGTTDKRVHRLLGGMLDTLYDKGRIDLLRAIQDGSLHPLACWERFRSGTLETFTAASAAIRFAEAFPRWYTTKRPTKNSTRPHFSPGHLANCRLVERLVNAARPAATLEDLPPFLAAYRTSCERAGRATSFRHARSLLRAFLRDTLGKTNATTLALTAIDPLTEHRAVVGPQPVARAREIREALPPAMGAIWWALCTTGMRPVEYWEQGWTVDGTAIRVHGQKTAHAERTIPRVDFVAKPARGRQRFAKALAPFGVTPYTARRTFAHWCEAAGIPLTRILQYLGHSPKGELGVTGLYTEHDVTPYLASDAAALRRLLLTAPATAKEKTA